jgi:hypothetical protein
MFNVRCAGSSMSWFNVHRVQFCFCFCFCGLWAVDFVEGRVSSWGVRVAGWVARIRVPRDTTVNCNSLVYCRAISVVGDHDDDARDAPPHSEFRTPRINVILLYI